MIPIILDKIKGALKTLSSKYPQGISAMELAKELNLDRANASRYLNTLCSQDIASKTLTRPVRYKHKAEDKAEDKAINPKLSSLDMLVGAKKSLAVCIEQAKAAILYPPKGLHTLVLGETGVGKSMFAELMYNFAIDKGAKNRKSPFISFNCSDYADNPL